MCWFILTYILSALACCVCFMEAYSNGGVYSHSKPTLDNVAIVFTPIGNTMYFLLYIMYFRNDK